MVGVFPARVVRVVRVADAVVLDPLADLHHVFLQLLEAAGEIPVDHRLGQRIGIVTIIVASLLGGSSGLSYWVLMSQPELYSSTRAFSHARAMHRPRPSIRGFQPSQFLHVVGTFRVPSVECIRHTPCAVVAFFVCRADGTRRVLAPAQGTIVRGPPDSRKGDGRKGEGGRRKGEGARHKFCFVAVSPPFILPPSPLCLPPSPFLPLPSPQLQCFA